MRLYQLSNLLLQGAIAFGIGGLAGWWISGSFGLGLQVGAIAVTASYASALIATIQRRKQEQRLRHSLRRQIDALLEKRYHLQQAIAVTANNQQELAASVGALQTERNQLLARVSELHRHRRQLAESVAEETSVPGDRAQPTEVLSARDRELNQIAFSKTIQIQQLEVRVAELRAEYERLQAEVSGRTNGNSGSAAAVPDPAPEPPSPRRSRAKSRRPKVDTISDYAQKKQLAERAPASDAALRLSQLTIPDLQQANPDELPQEWRDFANVLNADERAAIAAILNRNEAALKALADRQATMPEVLVETLNENALTVLGDTLFITTGASVVPDIHAEYAPLLCQALAATATESG